MRLYRSLQWKLAFSYTLVTVLIVLVLGFILLLLMREGVQGTADRSYIETTVSLLEAEAREVRVWLDQPEPDRDSVNAWLQNRFGYMAAQSNYRGRGYVVDAEGNLIGTSSGWPESLSLGEPIPSGLVPGFDHIWSGVLAGETTDAMRYYDGTQATIVVLIRGAQRQLRGALIFTGTPPNVSPALLGFGGVLLLLFAAATLLVGTAFGWLASRGLVRRLNAMMQTTEAWGRGDFSQVIRDKSGDEIGQLSRRLDQMAEQLQGLFQTRAALAATDERNRLARELHDNVKQNVFAAAMQIGAAKALLDQGAVAARPPLLEAEKLAQQARDELTGLIRQLRPAALEDRGLAEALRAYVAEWSQRFQIKADVRVQGERALPLEIEQALFRVAQEALANVSRHSAASKVAVELIYNNEGVALGIGDNGKGFALEAAQRKGIGLESMRERMEALGGYLQVVSQAGAGAHIVASVRHRTHESFRPAGSEHDEGLSQVGQTRQV
jgi:NarL family two-component system sensor histidine kinase LiaS